MTSIKQTKLEQAIENELKSYTKYYYEGSKLKITKIEKISCLDPKCISSNVDESNLEKCTEGVCKASFRIEHICSDNMKIDNSYLASVISFSSSYIDEKFCIKITSPRINLEQK